jgi:hypothetical protein
VKPVQGKVIEAAVLDLLTQVVEDETYAEEALDAHRKRTLRKLQDREGRLKKLATKRKTAQRERANLPPLAAKFRRLQKEEAALVKKHEALQSLEPGPLPTSVNVGRLQRAVETIRRDYAAKSIPEKQALFERQIQEVIWNGETLTVLFRAGVTDKGEPGIPEGLRLESGPLGKLDACTQPGCTAEVHARDLCRNHYRQALTGGGKPGHTAPGKGRITAAQREEIRAIYRSGGVSYRDLAQIFGVSYGAIRKLVKSGSNEPQPSP